MSTRFAGGAAALITLAAVLMSSVGTSAAQDGITVQDSSVNYVFGRQIEFTLTAASSAPITSAMLIFWARRGADGEICEPEFEPGYEIRAYCALDVAGLELTPFTLAGYSWELGDLSGRHLETEPVWFRYKDNRFVWELYERDSIRVHAAGVARETIEDVLAAAMVTAEELSRQLGVAEIGLLDIYLYENLFTLRSGLELPGGELMDAYSDPENGVIAISAEEGPGSDGWRRALPHEMAHIWLYRASSGAGIPLWLNEGYAMTLEPEPDPYMDAFVEEALGNGELLPFSSLCVGFPSGRDELYLAYAQSRSLVRYIRDRYGQEAIRSLLAAYAGGATCEGGVQSALGLSLDDLERGWRLHLQKVSGGASDRLQVVLWLVLLALTSLAMGYGFLYSGFRKRVRR